MNFWNSGSGEMATGKPESAFVRDFSVIPDNTNVLAVIKSILLTEKNDKKYYEIIWKITSDDYKNREVSQKIKVFDGKPEAIDRNLNMFKLIMDLCAFKPKHSNAPTVDELKPMIGRICGIKIREWSMPKADGSGMMEGNHVSEVHQSAGFEASVGVKIEVTHTVQHGVESALTRHSGVVNNSLDDDIPF